VYTLQTFPCIASSQAMVVSACYYGNSYWIKLYNKPKCCVNPCTFQQVSISSTSWQKYVVGWSPLYTDCKL